MDCFAEALTREEVGLWVVVFFFFFFLGGGGFRV